MAQSSKNDGWQFCAVEDCTERPRLSGFCTWHENEMMLALMDAPPYGPTTDERIAAIQREIAEALSKPAAQPVDRVPFKNQAEAMLGRKVNDAWLDCKTGKVHVIEQGPLTMVEIAVEFSR